VGLSITELFTRPDRRAYSKWATLEHDRQHETHWPLQGRLIAKRHPCSLTQVNEPRALGLSSPHRTAAAFAWWKITNNDKRYPHHDHT
jgi:hypothetical protein